MDKSLKSYIDSIPSERMERFKSIHNLILKMYPNVKVDLSYKMPTYRVEEGWVALANQKNYLTLYTCSQYHIQKFKEKNPNIKTGKGCINIKMKDDIAMADIEEVIRHAIEHPKEK